MINNGINFLSKKIIKYIICIESLAFYSNNINAQWFTSEEFNDAFKILKEYECEDCNYFTIDPDFNAKLLNTNISIKKNQEKIWSEHLYDLKTPLENKPVDTIFIENKKKRKKYRQDQIKKEHDWYAKRDKRIPPYNCLDYSQFLTSIFKENNDLISNEYFNNILVYNITSKEIFEVLSLLKITDSQKEIILSNKEASLRAKARIGDSISESLIITKFKEYFVPSILDSDIEDYPLEELESTCYDLFFINSVKTWDIFFYYLTSEVSINEKWSDTNNKTYISHQPVVYYLLKAYNQYYYSELTFFENYVYSSPEIWKLDKTMQDYIYIEIVSKYLSKKHERNINIQEYRREYSLPYNNN